MSRFFTIGHSNHTVEIWLALLRQHRIEVVVDTRSSPYSKYVPQFDRELMQRSLEEAGIRYLFFGRGIGRHARPTPPTTMPKAAYSMAGFATMPAFRRPSRALRPAWSASAWRWFAARKIPRTAIAACSSGACLAERGHTMLHIRGDGRLESDETVAAEAGKPLVGAQPALFAELDEDQWRSTASVSPKKAPASSSAH